ncbi:MAG: hypothetical protein PHY29_03000 [Syntrophales bacterium]|nr:hypothetical protein [Syntrophales bacterium]
MTESQNRFLHECMWKCWHSPGKYEKITIPAPSVWPVCPVCGIGYKEMPDYSTWEGFQILWPWVMLPEHPEVEVTCPECGGKRLKTYEILESRPHPRYSRNLTKIDQTCPLCSGNGKVVVKAWKSATFFSWFRYQEPSPRPDIAPIIGPPFADPLYEFLLARIERR